MKRSFVLTVSAVWLSAAALWAADPIYWGAYVPSYPGDRQPFEQNNAGGKGMSLVHWGGPWVMGKNADGTNIYRYFSSYQAQMQADWQAGRVTVLDWYSWDGRAEKFSARNTLDFAYPRVLAGDFDAYLREFARQAAAWKHPFFIRFNGEMNGSWTPYWPGHAWQSGTGTADLARGTANMIAAWRRMVDIFRAEGATNVTWVWCPNVRADTTDPAIPTGRHFTEFYPGDAYVDWLGLDGYNFAGQRCDSWRTFRQVYMGASNHYANSYAEITALGAGTKPLMIAEYGSDDRECIKIGTVTVRIDLVPHKKAQWITDHFVNLESAEFSRIKAINWFNWEEPGADRHWNIERSTMTQAAWTSGIASSYYAAPGAYPMPPDLQPIQPIQLSPPPDRTPPASPRLLRKQ